MSDKLEATKYLYVGIFADEKALQFLELLQALSDQCLQELHQVAMDKAFPKGRQPGMFVPSEMSANSPYGLAFHAGLQTIRNYWSPSVIQQEVDRLKSKCPYIEDLYKYTVVRYLQEVYRYERPQTISVTVPPLADFIHRFYIQIANNPLTKNLKYFTTFGLEKKTMMMDSVRGALFQILENQIDYQTSLKLDSRVPPPFPQTPVKATTTPLRPWSFTPAAAPPTPVLAPVRQLEPVIKPPVSHPPVKKEKKEPVPQAQVVAPPTPIPTLNQLVKEMREAKASTAQKVAKPTQKKPAPEEVQAPSSNKVKTIEIDVDVPLPPSDEPEHERAPSKREKKESPRLFDESHDEGARSSVKPKGK